MGGYNVNEGSCTCRGVGGKGSMNIGCKFKIRTKKKTKKNQKWTN